MEQCLYLVTGGAGHLGNHLVRKLALRGETVRVLALPGEDCSSLEGLPVELVRGDVCDKESLRPLFKAEGGRPLVVIHAAGIVSITSRHEKKVFDVNVGGTANVLALCKEYRVKKLVHVSSVHAIPELPAGEVMSEVAQFDHRAVVGTYAKSKAEATALVLQAAKEGLCACVVHPSGIIGPGDFGHGHLTQMIKDYLDGRLTAMVRGGYDFVDVRDVCDGILQAAELGGAGECYILSNQYVTVEELLRILHEVTGKRAIRTMLPMWFAKLTAPLAECYYRMRRQPPLYTAYSLYTLSNHALFSHQKATRELGYETRPLRETLADTAKWLRETKRVKPLRRVKPAVAGKGA